MSTNGRQDAGQSYPEWPKGLGDPLLHVRLLENRVAPRNRQEAVARFRSNHGEERSEKLRLSQRRPQLSQYENTKFPSRRCSFQVACKFAIATKQCYSCAKFDDKELGYYCDACFSVRHPTYRLDHSWTPLHDTTNQEEDWVGHVTRHRLEQDAAEVKLLIDKANSVLFGSNVAFSTKPPGFHDGFSQMMSVQSTLRELMGQINAELSAKPALSREEALNKIQRMWKLRKARKQLKALVREVFMSFVDPSTGQTYFYNTRNKTTQWTKPRALGSDELHPLETASTSESKHPITTRRKHMFASREEEEQYAAKSIQSMIRAHAARKQMRRIISSMYEKIWDSGSERFYYHNTRTKEVKWVKPRWVSDDDLLTPRSRYRLAEKDKTSILTPENDIIRLDEKPKKKQTLPLNEEDAAVMVQRMYRRKTGFQRLLELTRAVYERIYDPERQLYYYHNTRTSETTWEKPILLRRAQADVYTPRTRQKRLQLLLTGSLTSKRRSWTEETAAVRLQGLFRARKARRVLTEKLEQRFKKALDPESGLYYYIDTDTMAVSWTPPVLLQRANAELSEFT